MTCENTYTLPCQSSCGLWVMPFVAPETGDYWIQWEYEGTTYQKLLQFNIGDPIQFLWPFQSHGVFTFQILDADKVVILWDVEGMDYDCFNAVGIPTYDIDPGELAALLAICEDEFSNFEGDVNIRFSFNLDAADIVFEPPQEGHMIEGDVGIRFNFELDGAEIVVADPFDHEVSGEVTFRVITTEIAHIVLGDPPGFAYLLNGEDNVMQAFSFRRLTPAWTGPCIQVERWSDGATKNIFFNGGWIDQFAIADFCKGSQGGIRRFYNQMGAGGNWQQTTSSQQPMIYDGSNVIKINIGGTDYVAAFFDSGTMAFDLATGTVGPWNGSVHTAHIVTQTNGGAIPTHFYDNGITQYAGYAENSLASHFALAGTPEYWVNGAFQTGTSAAAYRTAILGIDEHTWMDDLDLSAWDVTSFGSGMDGYLFEYVLFNIDMSAQRLARTALTMPIYNL